MTNVRRNRDNIAMKGLQCILAMTVALTGMSAAQGDDFPELTGPYLGQKPPGKTPVPFPFDYMPAGYKLHSAPVFTPDGGEVYFSAMDFSVRFSEKIFVMKMTDSIWTPPQVASFSGDHFDGSPSMSRDGKYLFFSSGRKQDGDGLNEGGERNIWYVERMGENWDVPRPLSFRTPEWENGTDMSELGNLFFDSRDIYKTSFPSDQNNDAEKLSSAINSSSTELHPCVASDERFIVFYSSRPGHYGDPGGDLYISFKKPDGTWKEAQNLGEQFNKGHLSTSFPRLSPDGKYLFFLKLVSVPWQCAVYWVSVDALDDLNR
ncbi:MAG: PD40 domain-containing protein [Candidatus Zixiibacteriota bacterium]|nr:MAG: PD40 domain-containing protein [candidate division Zixibacteria bacterium]